MPSLKNNLFLIRLLMIVSQLLLTAFVIQWLISQYYSEKEILRKELSVQFFNAQEEVIDSMLVFHLIDPVMAETGTFNVQINLSDDSDSFPDSLAMLRRDKIIALGLPGEDTKAIFQTSDSLPAKHAVVFTTQAGIVPKDDILLKSIKLIIDKSLDSNDTSYAHIATSMMDTALLKETFADNIRSLNDQFTTRWESREQLDTVMKEGTIWFSAFSPGQFYLVEISGYSLFLLGNIFPQILFILVLLIMTGSAFIIAFRTLKKQVILNRMRNNFVSNISHELKTPVSTVKVALEALQKTDLRNNTEMAEEYLEMAEKEMNRLDLLISHVLNTSIYENGHQAINKEAADLKILVSEVMETLRPRFEQKGASVKLKAEEESYPVPVDNLHIQGVLINLLDNSLKYGGEQPEISLTLTNSDNEVTLSITDFGIGIPEEYLEKVFEKFFRVPKGDKHNTKGYGLGLSYAAMVMEQHGGAIHAENNLEKGVTFILTFPKESA